MRRLIGVLTVLAVVIVGAPPGWAQNPDPLHIGTANTPAGLEGGYITGSGKFQWLMLAAPQDCINNTAVTCPDNAGHVWFYNQACNRIDDRRVNLTKNDVAVLELHSALVTSNRVGNFLVAATDPALDQGQPLLTANAIIGRSFFVDTSRGIARMEDLARVSGNSGNGWSPYKPAHVVLFAPPDDGVTTTNTLRVRCPVGVTVQKAGAATGTLFGTQGTLGGDMLDLASQDEGNAAGSSYNPATTNAHGDTICDDCFTNGTFAVKLAANVYDLDENFLGSVDNIPCRCLGVDPGTGFVEEVRLSALSGLSATQSTYWEIFSFGNPPGCPAAAPCFDGGGDELFTADLNIRATSGSLNVNFWGRVHNARDRANIEF